MDAALKFSAEHWGDIASVIGLAVSVVGFIVTYNAAKRAKDASQLAKESTEKLRSQLAFFDVIAHISESISIIDEIRRLQRAAAWPILPDRYASLKRLLVMVRGNALSLGQIEVNKIAGVLQQITQIEAAIERAISRGREMPDVGRLNTLISEQCDRMNEVLTAVRNQPKE